MRSKPIKKVRPKSPGPGKYKLKFRMSEKKRPSFTIVGKTPIKIKRKAPGPGRYEYKTTIVGMKAIYKFGRG